MKIGWENQFNIHFPHRRWLSYEYVVYGKDSARHSDCVLRYPVSHTRCANIQKHFHLSNSWKSALDSCSSVLKMIRHTQVEYNPSTEQIFITYTLAFITRYWFKHMLALMLGNNWRWTLLLVRELAFDSFIYLLSFCFEEKSILILYRISGKRKENKVEFHTLQQER